MPGAGPSPHLPAGCQPPVPALARLRGERCQPLSCPAMSLFCVQNNSARCPRLASRVLASSRDLSPCLYLNDH